MCDDTAWRDPFFLQFVPDWFETQEQIDVWDDDNDYCNDNEVIEWYDGYKNKNPRKQKLKKS